MNRTYLTAIAVGIIGMSLSAQESVGNVTGTVKEKSGKGLAGARIVLRAPQMLGERVIVSSQDGNFRLPLLPPGDYVAQVTKDGYIGSKGMFRLSAGGTIRQDFVLQPIQQQTVVVEVVATSATVDKTETKTATTFSANSLQDLPLGLNSYAAMALAPGISGNRGYEQIRGGIAGQAVYQVNGISTRDPMVRQGRVGEAVLDDSIEDVQVIPSPLNARYGMSSSGIVNATTKTGSNVFTGSIRAKLNKTSWGALRNGGANALGTQGTPDSINEDSLQKSYEIFVSGPIIKDHLTFTYSTRLTPVVASTQQLDNPLGAYAGGNYVFQKGSWTDKQPGYNFGFKSSTEAPVILGKDTTNFHQFKLYYQINTEHQIEYFYTQDRPTYFSRQQMSSLGNATGFARTGEVNDYQSSDQKFYGFNYRGMLTATSVLDARYGFKKSHVTFPGGPNDPIRVGLMEQNATAIEDGDWVMTNGAAGALKPEKRDSQTIAVNYQLALDNATGSHSIDVGFEQLKEITFSPAQNPFGRIFYVPGQLSADQYMVYNYTNSIYDGRQGNPNAIADRVAAVAGNLSVVPQVVQNFGEGGESIKLTDSFYINDLWTINKHWSVMGGVRFDRGKVTEVVGERVKYSSPLPRAEVKFDIAGDSSRVLSLSYGEFRGTIGQSTIAAYSIGEGAKTARKFWNVGTNTPYFVSKAELTNLANYGYTYNFADPISDRILDPNLKPEKARELALNYRRTFAQGGFMRIGAIFRTYTDLIAQRGTQEELLIQSPTGEGAPIRSWKRILTNDPKGKRNYAGMELEWNLPLIERTLTFSGNWTFGRTTGTTQFKEGNVGSGNPFFWDQLAALGYNNWNPDGILPDSKDHQLKAWLGYNVTYGKIESSVNLLARYTSGSHWSATNNSSVMLSPDPKNPIPGMVASVPFFYGNRGAFVFPDFWTMDLQYNLKVPIAGKLQFFSALSVNNILNRIRPNDSNLTTGTRNASFNIPQGLSTANRSLAAVQADGIRLINLANFGWATSGKMYDGARGVNIDMGIRF